MLKKFICFAIIALMALPGTTFASKSDSWTSWWRPREWFSRNARRSTTVTGRVDSVAGDVVLFETVDGQKLQLVGASAAAIGEHRSVNIRVFGNVVKPNQNIPSGAIQVRNYRVLDEETITTPVPTVVEESVPMPYEPEPYLEPEPIYEPEFVGKTEPETYYEEEPSPLAIPYEEEKVEEELALEPELALAPAYEEYLVMSGDTLGRISQKVYGTTAKWKKIAEFNGITNPNLLRVGMTLRIPE